MAMGRRRRDRLDLPARLYFRHGAYYFVAPSGEWQWLARDRSIALRKYADLTAHPSTGTLAGLMERYLREAVEHKAPRTIDNNRKEMRPLRAAFGHMEPHELTPQDVYAYMDTRPKVAANREVALLSAVMKKAIRWGFADVNPCRQVSRNTETPRRRHVELAEFDAVRAMAEPVIQCAMDLARHTGLRLGDILRLNEREHVRDDGLYIETGKTKKRLLFEWTPQLEAAVQRARELRGKVRSTYLIATQRGQQYTVSGFESLWQRLMVRAMKAEKLRERFRFHDLRALAASRADEPSELLGHDDPRVTNRIYRRGPRRVKPAS
jgi:integrase